MKSSTVVIWRPQGLKDKTREQSVGWLHRSLAMLTAEAKRRAPVRTGRLRASITWEVDEEMLSGRYGSNVSYAIFQELGTSKISGKHYLEGALQKLKGKLDENW